MCKCFIFFAIVVVSRQTQIWDILEQLQKVESSQTCVSGTQTFKILFYVSLDDFMASSGARKHFSEIRNISLKIGYNRFKTVYICTISLFSTAFERFSEMLKLRFFRFLRFFAKHGCRVYPKLLSAPHVQMFHFLCNSGCISSNANMGHS